MDVTSNRSHARINHGQTQNIGLATLRGITLIELLTVLAIIAITLGIGIPGVSAIIQTNRMASAINTLSGSFALARSEAVTRNQEVLICKSRDGVFCTKKGGWEQGWIIFEDTNSNESRDDEEQLIRVQAALPSGITIDFSPYPIRAKHFVYYWPTGFTEMNGTFTFCPQNRPEQAKALILNKIGRLRKSPTKRDGSPLECGEIS